MFLWSVESDSYGCWVQQDRFKSNARAFEFYAQQVESFRKFAPDMIHVYSGLGEGREEWFASKQWNRVFRFRVRKLPAREARSVVTAGDEFRRFQSTTLLGHATRGRGRLFTRSMVTGCLMFLLIAVLIFLLTLLAE